MKFGYKIFLMAFILIIITTTTLGIILINNSYKINIENEINKGITEIININSTVNYNIGELTYLADNYLLNGMYIKIYNDGGIIFTNFKEHDKTEELINKNLDKDIKSYIKNGYLYMAYKDVYTIITKSDISEVISLKDEQINYFVKISILISLIVAFILSIIVSFMTKKIKKLQEAVKRIEEGDYEIKIPELGSDEIGDFASSISSMASSISENITKIEQISEQRKIFIGNLTHEIRTPLTSIIGYSSLIKNEKVTDYKKIKLYSTKIYEEGKYIEDMRDKLMNIIALNNKIDLTKENISKELKSYVEELKEMYPLVVFIPEIEDGVIKKIDKTLFKSLIFNLVKNGIKASSNPIIHIYLDTKKLIIEDNGSGIKKEDIEKIKEPFYTTNKDRNRTTSGMGLGLTLCCNIITIHNWTLDINSTLGIGTKMIIHLGGYKS